MYPIYFFIISIIGTLLECLLLHKPVVETSLMWILFSNVGLQGLFAFTGHFFKADKVAKSVGWPAGNPFQTEIAFTGLMFGILGILCVVFKNEFWLAVVIGRSIFSFGTAYVHINDFIKNKNTNPGNVGPVLWFSGIFIPLLMITLLFLR